MMSNQIPKVFISYSHDSKEHQKWVIRLATKLRNNGIDAILDVWDLLPGNDLPTFMETNIKESDFVLMICTKEYVKKANDGEGGVGYEKMIITSNYLKDIDNSKIIPIIKQISEKNVPTFIKTKLYIDLSTDDDFNNDELIRTILNSPLYEKPEIGLNPFKESFDIKENDKDSSLNLLIKTMGDDFDNNRTYTKYEGLHKLMGIRRIMLDFIIQKAINEGYIRIDAEGDLLFENKGKEFAINNNLL